MNVGANNHLPQNHLPHHYLPLQSLKLTDVEEWAIRQALAATGGKKMQAAELLGISYNSFKEKIRRYEIP